MKDKEFPASKKWKEYIFITIIKASDAKECNPKDLLNIYQREKTLFISMNPLRPQVPYQKEISWYQKIYSV